jgi:NADH dehydrogenase (ubiquinone) Fe-S protein 1
VGTEDRWFDSSHSDYNYFLLNIKIISNLSMTNLSTIELQIDDKVIEVSQGVTILQACETAGVNVPRFCYHSDLSIAGNCRMCLVALAGSPKLVASCMMPASAGMHVFTDSTQVRKAQQGVMEHLLVNHPLDCPICDQGGECDLQDQAQFFGATHGRFKGSKRAVEDKNIGPLIKTVMTRCIHCTRCIRFATEIAGLSALGTMGRGRGTEVGSYVERLFKSELSGNVIDLCPVGALTAKPQSFYSRSWEAEKVFISDVFDGLGTSLNVTVRGSDILRILPVKTDNKCNWISDKARFAYDGLAFQRLTNSLIKQGNSFIPCSWANEALLLDAKNTRRSFYLIGNFLDIIETQKIFFSFLKNSGSYFGINNPFAYWNVDQRSNFLYNSSNLTVDSADCCILVNCNPKKEGAVFFGRLRQRVTAGTLDVYEIGPFSFDSTFHSLGSSSSALLALLEGRHNFCKKLLKYKKVLFIKGAALHERSDYLSWAVMLERFSSIFFSASLISSDSFKYLQKTVALPIKTFHYNANECYRLDLALVSSPFGLFQLHDITSAYLFEYDNNLIHNILKADSVFYKGSHYDIGAQASNFILPNSTVFERCGLFMNTLGFVQVNKKLASEKAIFSYL